MTLTVYTLYIHWQSADIRRVAVVDGDTVFPWVLNGHLTSTLIGYVEWNWTKASLTIVFVQLLSCKNTRPFTMEGVWTPQTPPLATPLLWIQWHWCGSSRITSRRCKKNFFSRFLTFFLFFKNVHWKFHHEVNREALLKPQKRITRPRFYESGWVQSSSLYPLRTEHNTQCL